MAIKVLFTIVIVFCNYIVSAQQVFSLKGQVFDSQSNQTLSNVSIIVKQQKLVKCFTKTNEFGLFNFNCTLNLPITIEVSIIGYETVSKNIATIIDSMYIIKLSKDYKQLDSVKVESKLNYFKKGDITIIKADKYKNGDEDNLADLLKKIPNVEVTENGQISVAGKFVDRILIEGKDVLGKDYGKLVNNLTPKNIHEFEFIENYKDEDAIVSSKRENVLNIKYKKKSIVKGGKLTAGIQLPFWNHLLKGDVLISNKNYNGFHILNTNKIGEISDVILGNDFTKQIETLIPISQINDKHQNAFFTKHILKEKNYLNHNTSLIDNSHLFQITKRLKIKQILFFSVDKMNPTTQTEETTFFNALPIANTLAFNNTDISMQKFNSKTTLELKTKNQNKFKFDINIKQFNERVNLTGQLNLQNNFYGHTTKYNSTHLSADYKQYLKGVNYFNYQLEYFYQNNRSEQYEVGRIYPDFITSISTINDIKYNDTYVAKSFNAGIGYTIRSRVKNRDLSINLLKNTSIYRINNLFLGKLVNQSNYLKITSFSNGGLVYQSILLLPIIFQQQATKKTTNITVTPFLYNNHLKANRFLLNYYLNQTFNLSKKNAISTTITNKTEQGKLNVYNYNLLINRNTILLNGERNNYLPTINYYSLSFFHSKSLRTYFNVGVGFNTKKNGYTLNEAYTNYYKLQIPEANNFTNLKAWNIFANYSTKVINEKSSISVLCYQSFTRLLEKLMSVFYFSNFRTTQLNAKLNFTFTNFSFKTENRFSITSSKQSIVQQLAVSHEFLNFTESKFTISKRLFFSFETFNNLIINNSKKTSDEILINANIKHVPKNSNWRFSYWVNNIFNNKNFTRTNQSIFNKSVYSIPLIPINFVLKVDYQF